MDIAAAILLGFLTVCAWVCRVQPLQREASLVLLSGLVFSLIFEVVYPAARFAGVLFIDTIILTWMTHMYLCAKSRRVEWPLHVALLHFGMLCAHALFYWLKFDYFWYMTAVNIMVYCSAIIVASGPVINAVRAELGLVNFALSLLVGRQLMARDKAA